MMGSKTEIMKVRVALVGEKGSMREASVSWWVVIVVLKCPVGGGKVIAVERERVIASVHTAWRKIAMAREVVEALETGGTCAT